MKDLNSYPQLTTRDMMMAREIDRLPSGFTSLFELMQVASYQRVEMGRFGHAYVTQHAQDTVFRAASLIAKEIEAEAKRIKGEFTKSHVSRYARPVPIRVVECDDEWAFRVAVYLPGRGDRWRYVISVDFPASVDDAHREETKRECKRIADEMYEAAQVDLTVLDNWE